MTLIEKIYDEQYNALKHIDAPMFLILDKKTYKDLINEILKSDPVDMCGNGIIGLSTFIGLRVCILNESNEEEIWVK